MTALRDLREVLPSAQIITDPSILESYRSDQAGTVGAGHPSVVVMPSETAHVQAICRIASRHAVPIVARGEGSGLSGGANATDGCIVLSSRRMNQILEIDAANLVARVQPGVINGDLKRAVAEVGLWYTPDPASQDISSIGGNLATNAGGLCCVKYGVTRDSVLSLDVVLADGRLARLGHATVKDVAGYDLVGLMVGSEGTLGIITEATLRLRPPQPTASTVVATFAALSAAGQAIAAIRSSVVPALLEVLDRTTIRAVDDLARMGLDRDAAALVVAQSDAGSGVAETDEIRRHCAEAGATFVAVSTDPDEADMLLQARRLAYPALEQRGATLLDDVAVPVGRIAELLAAVEVIAEETGTVIGTFGHAGDGNMHPTVVFDRDDEGSVAAAREAFRRIISSALDLGGTITGEHGVGLLKQPYLGDALDETARWMHRRIKQALDPDGILNPGKAVP